jgi:hypothetical protein
MRASCIRGTSFLLSDMLQGRTLLITSSIAMALLVSSCGDAETQTPTEQEERIARAYAELTLLSESARLGMLADSSRTYDAQVDSVLRSFDLRREDFEADFRRFADDPERSTLLFTIASGHIQELRAQRDSSARTP